MKVLNAIKKFFLGVLTFAFFVYAIAMTFLLLNFNDYGVTEVGDTSVIIIKDKIANDNYKKGDIVLVENKQMKSIEVGDELFAYRIDSKGAANIEIGTVGQVHLDSEAVTFENGDSYSYEFLIGEGTKTIGSFGTFLSLVESKWGFLFTVLVPSFIFFVYNLYALIVEIKYGDEE
jgi:hypothetical protein